MGATVAETFTRRGGGGRDRSSKAACAKVARVVLVAGDGEASRIADERGPRLRRSSRPWAALAEERASQPEAANGARLEVSGAWRPRNGAEQLEAAKVGPACQKARVAPIVVRCSHRR